MGAYILYTTIVVGGRPTLIDSVSIRAVSDLEAVKRARELSEDLVGTSGQSYLINVDGSTLWRSDEPPSIHPVVETAERATS